MDLLELALSQRKESADIKKKVLNKSNDDDDSENTLQAQFKGAVKTQQIKNLSDSTFGKLSPSEVISARMTEVSYINYRDGAHAASSYVKKYLPEYRWDKALTTEHLATFINKETGKVRVGLRGTQNLEDWKTNARILTSTMGQSTQIKDIDKSMLEIFNKYGKDNVEILSGHSKGAGTAFYFGEKYGIDTHLQDPPISTNELFGGKTKAKHMIAKTPGDLVSAASNVAVFRKGISITDLKQRGEGFKGAHHLGVMTGTDYKKLGSKVFDPKLKNQAFIMNELKKGKTAEEIVKDVGYSSKESRKILRDEIANAIATPETHESILKESGFLKSEPSSVIGIVKKKVIAKVVPKIDVVLGKTLNKVAKITSAGGIAGILSSVGTSQALSALGSDNALVNEGVIGAVSNATQDAAANAYKHFRSRGHHVPINNAVASLPEGEAERLLAQATTTTSETVVRTAEQVSTAGRIASIGTRALASLGKGGLGGIIGAGTQMATQAALQAMGVDEHTSHLISRLAGAAASGAIFGPQAVVIFLAIESAMIAFEEIWNFFTPQQTQEEAEEEIEEAKRTEYQRVFGERDAYYAAIYEANMESIRQRDRDSIAEYGMSWYERQDYLAETSNAKFIERVQSDGLGVTESMWNRLKFYPSVLRARTSVEANNAIRDIFDEIRTSNNVDINTYTVSARTSHNWERDFIDTIDANSKDVPQFDENGELIVVKFSEAGGTFPGQEGVVFDPDRHGWTRGWNELNQPPTPILQKNTIEEIAIPKSADEMTDEELSDFIESEIVKSRTKKTKTTTPDTEFETELDTEFQEESEIIYEDEEDYDEDEEVEVEVEEEIVLDRAQKIKKPISKFTTPHTYSNRSTVLDQLNRDPKIASFMRSGDHHSVNKSIREFFYKNRDDSNYGGAIDYGDPSIPQSTLDGRLIYQSYNDKAPTTDLAVQEQNNII